MKHKWYHKRSAKTSCDAQHECMMTRRKKFKRASGKLETYKVHIS